MRSILPGSGDKGMDIWEWGKVLFCLPEPDKHCSKKGKSKEKEQDRKDLAWEGQAAGWKAKIATEQGKNHRRWHHALFYKSKLVFPFELHKFRICFEF